MRARCPKLWPDLVLHTALLTILLQPLAGIRAEQTAPARTLHIQTLAASCAACHGTNGNSVGGMPVLAGSDKAHFISLMQAFRSGERPATVMHRHAKGLTPEEIEQLAAYFSEQKRVQAFVPQSQESQSQERKERP